MAAGAPEGRSAVADAVEEFLIAFFLGVMTLVTFANVIVRYVFSSDWFRPVQVALDLPTNLLWSLETTVFLFAWLVLLGISYSVRHNAHLGVDIVINSVGRGVRKPLTLIAGALCILYAALLLKGGWDYWANFANLPQTTGRWVPTGLEQEYLGQAWYEVNDIPMPDWLQWVGTYMNAGEDYEKIPRFIPYFVLPLGFLLLLIRFVQATVRVWQDRQETLIASHEVDEMIDQVAARDRTAARD